MDVQSVKKQFDITEVITLAQKTKAPIWIVQEEEKRWRDICCSSDKAHLTPNRSQLRLQM